jgi:hypothetical protein
LYLACSQDSFISCHAVSASRHLLQALHAQLPRVHSKLKLQIPLTYHNSCWLLPPLCCQGSLHVFEWLAVEHCIDPALRFNCPFTDCSCLMELSEKARSKQDTPLTCPGCGREFCIACGIAGWHAVRASTRVQCCMHCSVACVIAAATMYVAVHLDGVILASNRLESIHAQWRVVHHCM